jgi:hypothetical protein
MPRPASAGHALARAAAETPAVEQGTWFDTCPGRGANWNKGSGNSILTPSFSFAAHGNSLATKVHDQRLSAASPISLRSASSSWSAHLRRTPPRCHSGIRRWVRTFPEKQGSNFSGMNLSCANIAAPDGPCCSPLRVPVFCPDAITTLMATTLGVIRIRNPTPGVPLTRREPIRRPHHQTRQTWLLALLLNRWSRRSSRRRCGLRDQRLP